MATNVATAPSEAPLGALAPADLSGWSSGQLKQHMAKLKHAKEYGALREIHALHLSESNQGHMAVLLGTSRSFNLHIATLYSSFAPDITQRVLAYAQHLYSRAGVVGDFQIEELRYQVSATWDFFDNMVFLEMLSADFQKLLLELQIPILEDLRGCRAMDIQDLEQSYAASPVRCIKTLSLMSRDQRLACINTLESESVAAVLAKLDLISSNDLNEIHSEVVRSTILQYDLL